MRAKRRGIFVSLKEELGSDMLDDKIQDSLQMNFLKQNLYTYIFNKDKTIRKLPKLEIRCITCSY